MGNPSTITRIDPTNVTSVSDLISAINPFIAQCTGLFDNGLCFRQNFMGCVRSFNVVCPEEWVTLTPGQFGSGWMPVDPVGDPIQYCRKDDGTVEWRGRIKSGTVGVIHPAIPLIGALAAIRPSQALALFPVVTGGYAHGAIQVMPSGMYVAFAPDNTLCSLNGIRYSAADRTPAPWTKPIDLSLDDEFRGARPGQCFVLQARDDVTGTLHPEASIPVIHVLPRSSPKANLIVRIPRVFGLVPGRKYTVTALFLAVPGDV